jgi:hypothetical protein
MTAKLNPFASYQEAYQKRQQCPLTLPGDSYKLQDARHTISAMLETAEAALDHEYGPAPDPQELYGCCLAGERYAWARQTLAEGLPYVLGYNAVPGLEVMGRADLTHSFTTTLWVFVLPTASRGLELPDGASLLKHVFEVLEGTLLLIGQMVDACEMADA